MPVVCQEASLTRVVGMHVGAEHLGHGFSAQCSVENRMPVVASFRPPYPGIDDRPPFIAFNQVEIDVVE